MWIWPWLKMAERSACTGVVGCSAAAATAAAAIIVRDIGVCLRILEWKEGRKEEKERVVWVLGPNSLSFRSLNIPAIPVLLALDQVLKF